MARSAYFLHARERRRRTIYGPGYLDPSRSGYGIGHLTKVPEIIGAEFHFTFASSRRRGTDRARSPAIVVAGSLHRRSYLPLVRPIASVRPSPRKRCCSLKQVHHSGNGLREVRKLPEIIGAEFHFTFGTTWVRLSTMYRYNMGRTTHDVPSPKPSPRSRSRTRTDPARDAPSPKSPRLTNASPTDLPAEAPIVARTRDVPDDRSHPSRAHGNGCLKREVRSSNGLGH